MTKKSNIDFSKYEHFKIIGIACHEDDLRTAWEINNSVGIILQKKKDLIIDNKGEKQIFPLSSCFSEESNIEYSLISNKSENGYLFPQYKNVDFFLKLNGNILESEINKTIKFLRTAENIITAFKIKKEDIKNLKKIKAL